MHHALLRRRLATTTLAATFAGAAFAGAAQAATPGHRATSSARTTNTAVEKKDKKQDKKNAKKSRTKTVKVRMFRFPDSTTVRVGTKVVWKNRDQILHTVSGVDDLSVIDGELDGAGAKVKVTFTEAGTYEYFCMIHPVMQGRVVVEG